MKLKILVFIIVSLIIIAGIGIIIYQNTSFTVLATSYAENSTSVYNYKGEKLVGTDNYSINDVERLESNKRNDPLLRYNEYGEELIRINGDNIKKYKVKYSPLQLVEYKEHQVILHNGGINSFSISKYDSQ